MVKLTTQLAIIPLGTFSAPPGSSPDPPEMQSRPL